MNKVNAAVAVLAIAASFAATDSFSQGNAPGRPDVNVNVTNTPLPVTLTNPVTTVTIANPVTSSTVTVNNPASSPIPVTIANVPAAPIVVQLADPGTTPYQHTQSFNPGAANCTQNNLNCTTTFPAVPAGKRLVIQHASADFALTPGGTFPRASLRSPNSGVTLALPVPIRTGP